MSFWRSKTVLVFFLSTFGLFSSLSNALVLKAPEYSITFAPDSWDTLQSSVIVAKSGGLGGVGLLTCTKGSVAPNIDSLSEFYADSLGGRITKGKDSSLVLGKYQVKWQEFKYDSLPKLSAQILKQSRIPISLKDGTFRIYYLLSDGLIFTLTALPMTKLFPPPYADVETALKTLTLNAPLGIRLIMPVWGSSEMWIRSGRLGGAWFSANRPVSIDCFNMRGSWIGSAQSTGSSGIWTLPAVDGNTFLRIILADGSRFHLPTRE